MPTNFSDLPAAESTRCFALIPPKNLSNLNDWRKNRSTIRFSRFKLSDTSVGQVKALPRTLEPAEKLFDPVPEKEPEKHSNKQECDENFFRHLTPPALGLFHPSGGCGCERPSCGIAGLSP